MKRRLWLVAGCAGTLMLAGCASPNMARPTSEQVNISAWSGRLSLSIDSDRPQTYAALFELHGNAERGDLRLSTPIGTTLATLRWRPGEAVMNDGRNTRNYPSADALLLAATGAAIPAGALFAWLQGRDVAIDGWHADLSRIADGRLRAQRDVPQPAADLRMVFERL